MADYSVKPKSDLIARGIEIGMYEMLDENELEVCAGQPIVGGGFAVPREMLPGQAPETRMIAPLRTTNQVVDGILVQQVGCVQHVELLGGVTTAQQQVPIRREVSHSPYASAPRCSLFSFFS